MKGDGEMGFMRKTRLAEPQTGKSGMRGEVARLPDFVYNSTYEIN